MSTEVWRILGGIVALIVLVLLNAYFVSSEYGLVASRRSRIEQLAEGGNARARWVQRAQADVNPYISATQVGITVVSLLLGQFGEPVLGQILEPLLAPLPNLGPVTAGTISFVLSFLIVTYFTILFSELLPKRVAIQRPEMVALAVIGPLRFFLVLFRPLIWLLNNSASFFTRRFGLGDEHENNVYSEEELRILVRESEQEGVLEQGERELIDRVFSFADKEAAQVMVPRTQVRAVDITTRVAEVAPQVARSVYTRFPVYEETIDTIRGFVHVKDIVAAMGSGRAEQPIGEIMRSVLIVPQSVHIDHLMRDMRRTHTHMAVLVDDYGGTAGLVTMEDLIEELVGDIEDEFDPAGFTTRRNTDGSVTLDGRTPIADAVQLVPLIGTESGSYETLAGYVLARAGRIPKLGETVEADGLLIHVDRMDRLRIAQVTIRSATAPPVGATLPHPVPSTTVAAD